MGYDSNIFYANENDTNDGITSGTFATAELGLGVKNRRASKVGIGLDTTLAMRYFATDSPGANIAENANGVNDFTGSAYASFLPRSSVTTEVHVDSDFSRRPASAISTDGYDRLDVKAGLDLRFRPGSNPESRPFELRIGGRAGKQQYLDPPDRSADRAEKNYFTGQLLSRWRFLPKTALVLQIDYLVNDYQNNSLDGTPLTGVVALQGLITNRLSVDLRFGYHNSMNDSGESYSGLVGRAQVEYRLEPTLSVKTGYARTSRDTSYSNFVTVDRLFVTGEVHIGRRISVTAGVDYDSMKFSTSNARDVDGQRAGTASNAERVDPVLRVKAGVKYRIGDVFSMAIAFKREDNTSDFRLESAVANGTAVDYVAYSRQVVMVRAEARY